jgi:hypothetical protein
VRGTSAPWPSGDVGCLMAVAVVKTCIDLYTFPLKFVFLNWLAVPQDALASGAVASRAVASGAVIRRI